MTSADHHYDISFTSPMECLPVKIFPMVLVGFMNSPLA